MKKKNKKIIFSIVLLVIVALVILFFTALRDNENKLTLVENKWIDSNKYNVIDISVLNNVPVISYNGNGVLYSYIDFVTQNYSLKFNLVSLNQNAKSNYSYNMDIVNSISDNDIKLLEDNLILILKDKTKVMSFEDVKDLKIGIESKDQSDLSPYLENKNIEIITFDSYNELTDALKNEEEESKLDGIITLKNLFMKELIEDEYVVSFEFNDLERFYVIKANGYNELNSILKKSFNVYKSKHYYNDLNKYQLESYFKFKKVSDMEDKSLKSKKYVYGFIDYGVYNNISGNSLSGLSGLILKDFNKFSNLSMTYVKYNSISSLLKDFNEGKVDFMLNISGVSNAAYSTVDVFDKNLVVISGLDNKDVVDSIHSLKDKKVLSVKDSSIEKYLLENGIKVKAYNNFKDLSKDFKSTDMVVVDLENYNYYKSSAFKNVKINYLFNLNNGYNYVINNNYSNQVFADLFDFYLNFTSTNKVISSNYDSISYRQVNITSVLIVIVIILCIYVCLDFIHHLKSIIKAIKNNRKVRMSKEDKMKYIDQLTSLKNRAYFNSQIESWNDSEVYPQAIIIVDLNNISYINDNFGREEGDKVITEAANILIQYQLQNTDIMRTDGNEFLIYMVGYDEKHVVTYLRKLNKEFKNLSHGFGAASGYSIINDAIKTVDDAVNEATLDMKNNKEDIEY